MIDIKRRVFTGCQVTNVFAYLHYACECESILGSTRPKSMRSSELRKDKNQKHKSICNEMFSTWSNHRFAWTDALIVWIWRWITKNSCEWWRWWLNENCSFVEINDCNSSTNFSFSFPFNQILMKLYTSCHLNACLFDSLTALLVKRKRRKKRKRRIFLIMFLFPSLLSLSFLRCLFLLSSSADKKNDLARWK